MLISLYNHLFRSKVVPKASEVLRCYIRQRDYPPWTSYFISQYNCLNDQFGQSHFEFDVDGRNYHILRTGNIELLLLLLVFILRFQVVFLSSNITALNARKAMIFPQKIDFIHFSKHSILVYPH